MHITTSPSLALSAMAWGRSTTLSMNTGSTRPATRNARARERPSAATTGASPAAYTSVSSTASALPMTFTKSSKQSRVRLFEVGTRFEIEGGRLAESQSIAGIASGTALPEQWSVTKRDVDFYDVKSDVEALFALTGRQAAISYVASTHAALHPGRCAAVMDGGERVGWIGQLRPEITRKLELREAPWLFELSVDRSFRAEVPVFSDISKYPAIRRDLAIIVDESVTLDELRESVNLAAKGLLRELHVFDVYRGKGVEPGRKSIALGLILQETSRTLTDGEADAVVAAVVERVKGDLKAGIRE